MRDTPPAKKAYIRPTGEKIDIFSLLDQLVALEEKAKHLPGGIMVGFDRDQFYYLVLKLRANLPDDMKKAVRVTRDSERIVGEARDAAVQQLEQGRADAARALEAARADSNHVLESARREANQIIENSRAQASKMIDKTEVHQMATAQAHDILKRAETEASEIRKGADDYARDVLANLEGVMGKAIATIQRGRETLDRARA